MTATHCPAKDDPNSKWPHMCPQLGPAYLFAVLFALTSVAHLTQAILHRKAYCWVITMSALWQTFAYVFRILSIQYVDNLGFYITWFILILLAPLWTNAFVYMVVGRMIFNYTTSSKVFKIKAWRLGLIFVLSDIVAFLVQASGASMASGDNLTDDKILRGLHIYMVGIGLQQVFIICFLALVFRFHRQMNLDMSMASKSRPLALLYVIYTVLVLITIRIIFRLIEYAKGFESTIPKQEAYQYIFDSLPMLVALVLFHIVHPGRIMAGKEADFPSRKQRKAAGKNYLWGRAGLNGGGASMHYTSEAVQLGQQNKFGPHTENVAVV